MGIALFTLSSLLSPLQGLLTRLMPANNRPAECRPPRSPHPAASVCRAAPRALRSSEPSTCPARAASRTESSVRSRTAPALRVVRMIDAGIPAGSTGRMKISGRMADVCAELDRLAALEATS